MRHLAAKQSSVLMGHSDGPYSGKNWVTLFLFQVRLASQELLVAELKNMGPTGRKHLVEVDLTTILLLIKIGKTGAVLGGSSSISLLPRV